VADSSRAVNAASRQPATEGITFFDHPDNSTTEAPAPWHVREDGWMGVSPGMHGPLMTTQTRPLVMRYLLHAHGGAVNPDRAKTIADEFAQRNPYGVRKSTVRHHSHEIVRS